ncbi:hypothetical protein AB0C52_13195 [Streptomyces sp. NPDC048717]|uniref:hypothetical protein n=1 Tax=Streptomyces sp. NPDC048717 TaxID=3154928 RepID=UPI003439BF12
MSKLAALRAVTQGEIELRDWHKRLRFGAAGAGFGMMTASLYQLHWAGTLVGFPTVAAGAMAVSLETLLAFNAGAVTTIRRRDAHGKETGYYWSLWLIFGFLLTISIAANVGHAMAALATWFGSGEAPQVLDENRAWVYAVGSAVAAMVPLGGSFGLHISGFVRARGAGSDWVDPEGARVLQGAPVTVPAPLPADDAGGETAEDTATAAPEPEKEVETAEEGGASGLDSAKGDKTDGVPEPLLGEEELYKIWKAARDNGEESRFGRNGDLNPSSLGRRLGYTPQNGRKNVGPRFEARYRAEKLKEQGGGVDLEELSEPSL